MSYRFHHTCSLLLLSGRYELSKVARVTHKWRRICTCIAQGRSDKQSDQNLFLGGEKGLMLTFTRHQQTLPSDFGVHLPSIKQIENFLSSRKVQFEHGHTSLIASCPFCPENSDATQKLKPKTLYINKTTGSHFCKNCGVSGTWQKFKISCLENQGKSSSGSLSLKSHSDNICDHDHVSQIWNASTPINECPDDVWQKFVTFFKIKELRKDILTKFEVRFTERECVDAKGKSKKHKCVVFPWYDVNNSTVRGVKLVKLDSDVSDSSFTIEPRQGFLGLFGWNTVDPEAKEVVLVSTEFDAMAVSQSTSYPSVSLPLGTNSLPPEVLPQLEQFEKIFLWFGNDVFSRQAVNQFSRKLNLNRCFLVRPTGDNTPSNALDALNSGHDLTALVSAAQPTSHEKITTFHQLRSDVYDQFVNADQVAGVKWTRFPKLSGILKGFRRGEVTVFTGPTGAGKTTLLSEMSLDLCLQGVNTLWGSFEIRNVRLVKMMLCQYSGLNLENKVEQFQYWADKFEMLPMYFMCFYGAQNINTVIETMSHAAYVYDIDHVIVDNLQFMTSYLSRGDDRFSAQNHVIAALRNFATSKNVHVTLVIHPRKENEEVELQTASIFGSAKASQEADNVIILQSKKGTAQKYLQVTKNRFDGVLGRVPLDFVKESLSMSGFGKVLQPNRPTNVDKSGNEKYKPTRLTGDVSDVKFSAPRMFGSYKPFDKNARIPQPSTKKEIFDNNATTDNPASSSDSKRQMENEIGGETTNNGKMADEFDVGISQEKKENVQRTVKKILSGTRLITKAVTGPRSYNNIRGKSPTDRKQNTS